MAAGAFDPVVKGIILRIETSRSFRFIFLAVDGLHCHLSPVAILDQFSSGIEKPGAHLAGTLAKKHEQEFLAGALAGAANASRQMGDLGWIGYPGHVLVKCAGGKRVGIVDEIKDVVQIEDIIPMEVEFTGQLFHLVTLFGLLARADEYRDLGKEALRLAELLQAALPAAGMPKLRVIQSGWHNVIGKNLPWIVPGLQQAAHQ